MSSSRPGGHSGADPWRLLIVIVLTIWMFVHTGIFGLVLFIGALVGLLYFLVRKAV